MLVRVLFFFTFISQSFKKRVHALSSGGIPAKTLTQTINNLNAIVTHIQNPDLYSPEWANKIECIEKSKTIVAACDILKGELITLYPIQSVSIEKESCSTQPPIDNISNRVELLQEERYPYPNLRIANKSVYIHSDKDVAYAKGWYGNIIPKVPKELKEQSNCMFIPLPSVAPLCGMVATRSIAKGEYILSYEQGDSDNKSQVFALAEDIANKYAFELGDLLPYLDMAYSHIQKPLKSAPIIEQQTYQQLNHQYAKIQKIHSKPDIFTVEDFLSEDECERLILKAQMNIQPCLIKNEETGAVERDPSRTSTNANIPIREVPTITKKLINLSNCRLEQMETLQVLNYKKGQKFNAHTDGFDGATSACGFLDSGRIVTLFCYLNDVEEGGSTIFTQLQMDIKPKRGMAVIHHPMSLDLVEDEKTEHTGSSAIDEKWLLTTFFWKHWKSDFRYSEDNIESLSTDVI